MSRKLRYESPRLTVHGDIRQLTRAGSASSALMRMWVPGQEVDPPEPTGMS